jgi:CTP synthase
VHGGLPNDAGVNIRLIESEELERGNPEQFLSDADGILIPGGFGTRGIEGKVTTIRYAREKGIPFLGLCLGMQCAVVEFARHVAGLEGANSGEFDSATDYKVIDLLPEQRTVEEKGGSMRLGGYVCRLQKGSLAEQIYGTAEVQERHRHRYEFNNDFREILTSKGLVLSGTSPDGRLVEIIELQNHPWFVGTQFHPEYRSRPHAPHPVFRAFIHAALKRKFGR